MATTFTPSGQARGQAYPPSGARKVLPGTLVTDGTDGASAGDIPASVFGLRVVEEVTPLVKSTNNLIVVVGPTADGSSVLGKNAASAASADIPSGTYSCTVRGY